MTSFSFTTNLPNFKNDFEEVFRAFGKAFDFSEDGLYFGLNIEKKGKSASISVNFAENPLDYSEKQFNLEDFTDEKSAATFLKTEAKIFLYDVLSAYSGIKLPYGSLTGIRPTKLFSDLKNPEQTLSDYYKVSKEKVLLVSRIAGYQSAFKSKNEKDFDLFVNVPVCPSRCSYCSFLSAELRHLRPQTVADYCKCLIAEIRQAENYIAAGNNLRAIYVGGGTPTSLPEDKLAEVLSELKNFSCKEFTVEAGRPDTIDESKLKTMKACGVTRISVNPQTFNDKTLKVIGRKHSAEEVLIKYQLAKSFGFGINMDLIAMLPGESFTDFKYSLHTALSLSPDNITVHTFSVKAGSKINEQIALNSVGKSDAHNPRLAKTMTEYAYKQITEQGYSPYYMYRQKYADGGLENIGYAKEDRVCLYNIDMMEETNSIFACGAGAVSKTVADHGKTVKRFGSPKGMHDYLRVFDANFNKKTSFFGL